MTTTIERPITEPCDVVGSGYRRCEGCPRCQDSDAGFCKVQHSGVYQSQTYQQVIPYVGHPICKKCGHCVLRGSHADDISDLEVQGAKDD